MYTDELISELQRRVEILMHLVSGLMFSEYLNEWRAIDGLLQHPEGLSFGQWRSTHYPIYEQLYQE